MKALFLFFLLAIPLLAPAQSLDKARRLFKDGNHREAADMLQPIVLSAKTDPQTTAEALSLLARCVDRFEETSVLEKALETAVKNHPMDHRVLFAAAWAYRGLLSAGEVVDGVLVRRLGDHMLDTDARDHVRSTQLLIAALQAVENGEPKERVEMLWTLYEWISSNGQIDLGACTKLTDFGTLPDYDADKPSYSGDGAPYPCDTNGKPIFFAVPTSWDVAKNDGERIRWLLDEMGRLAPGNARVTGAVWASLMIKSSRTRAAAKVEEVRQMADDEVWTVTTKGEQRFRLPPDHAFMHLYRAFLEPAPDEKQLILPSGINMAMLRDEAQGGIYRERMDRHQYEALVVDLQGWMKSADKEDREWMAEEIDQITGAWGRFLGLPPQPAGKKVSLPFYFRNATQVTFTARRIDVAGILAETEQRYSAQTDVEIVAVTADAQAEETIESIHSIGTRLLLKDADQFLSKPVAEWKADLQPAAHHEDASATIHTPLSEGGAYFVEAKLAGGHVARCVLWIESITLVATPVKDGMHYFVADAITGAPVAGAELQLFGFKYDWQEKKQLTRRLKITTDADGTATAQGVKMDDYLWLVRTQLADGRETHLGFEEVKWAETDSALDAGRLFIITDRPVYRPGQKVSWHAWAKRVGYDPKLETNAYARRDCRVTITSPREDKLSMQELTTDAHGALSGSITLAEGAMLGEYDIKIEFEGRRELSQTQRFRVEEYMKPEFAVNVEGPVEPVALGDEIEFMVKAEYYFGGAVKDGAVKYSVSSSRLVQHWPPPGPWDWLYRASEPVAYDVTSEIVAMGKGMIDENGLFRVRVPTQKRVKDDFRFTIEAEVTDASRRVIKGLGSAFAVQQPFEAFVTLDRGWYATGESGTITVAAHSLDGTAVKARGSLRVFHGDKLIHGFAVDLPTKAEFRLLWPQGGAYRLELALKDEKGREVKTTKKTFVHGEGAETAAAEFAGLEIEVEKKEYQPGQEVRMLIHTEKPGSTVVLFLRGQNRHAGEPVVLHLAQKTTEYRFPVTAADQPNLIWAAYLLHDLHRHETGGEILLPPVQRVVKVELTTDSPTYGPRGHCHARLVARDAAGKPVKGRMVLTAYDKALEYISEGSNVESILKRFWGWKRHGNFIFQDTLRALERNPSLRSGKDGMVVHGGEPTEDSPYWNYGWNPGPSHPLAAHAPPPPACVAGIEEPETALMIRREFADSAAWRQAIETDENGVAEVEFPFPDNLTTWKLKAWAMGPQAEVGEAEVEVITRKDLLVRLQAPRFFVERDEVLLSAIVHNDHATAQLVETTLELENGTLEAVEPLLAAKSEVEAHGEKRIEWRVRAKTAGEAKIRVSAVSKAGGDAMEMTFPVRVRGAERVESTSLFLATEETSRRWSLTIPEARRVDSTRYELRYTSSLVPSILDALPPLIDFPHGCAEQTLNRFVPVVVAVDLMKKLKLEHPEYTESKARSLARTGLARLTDMRVEDGGWGWFAGAREPSAHMTALVVRGLQMARHAGLPGTEGLITEGAEWLKEHEEHELERLALPKKDKKHKATPDDTDALVHAALITEKAASVKMRGLLYYHRAGLSRQMLALLGLACHHAKETERRDMCLRNLRQHVQQDDATQTAWLKLPTERWWCWENDPIETQAMFLRLLLAVNPADALAPRVVKHLIQNKRHTTHWNSTRDTAAVIQALAYYAQVTREPETKMDLEFVLDGKTHTRVHLDAKNLLTGDHRFVLEAGDLPTGKHTLEVRKTGTGPLYAAGALTVFSQEEVMPAAGLDIQAQRRFYRVEDDDKRTEIASDTPLRSGDMVEVELTLESKNDAEYLLVEDFKPAGFESVSVRSGWNWHGLPCYQEFRDEKVCLYVERLPQGRHKLRYLVRAVTPGRFTALPAQVSAMYAPELRANSAGWQARVAE